ncbi:MAG: ABC transporter substrate-binding protein [Hoeflea sp.]|uniref:ABC transporter substrate-binding protein n=1 Tax=Hoeflea sp. TaxID=1940281 RepID=UPI001D34DEC4|nr:ABC transporter substrate-binding protein [Hoeflea sp.]MBU4531715.1 ABC transporter substrate-binding protein [Alphaproteobacteria bacterium]MBU4544571.1 ABC transporter substrate-binding protein [Alphaproteobacteria bacterium]MBU4552802.1 ABC transporter substrate-binding protein [Alphaproteobacteria bacterium]MBV1724991.1 ABC transporter substrate-binding protein [Hoeflea sp.]MBV1761011.1 ABC transporter substrate-binding protein [Hoeflea sp.]
MIKSPILFAGALSAALAFSQTSHAADPDPRDWDAVLQEAKGQTVYFNAWGGSENINLYIDWAGQTLKERFGVTVVHVKLDDTANAVATVLAEKAAGKSEGGSVDLIWINGENFASMKRQDLLMAPDWTTSLPNWAYVDHETKPTILTDFTIPTDGLESPWGGAKMVFFHDTARTPADSVPGSSAELLDWAERNPGRFSYPQPPDFIGSSFLKQVLSETIADPAKLSQKVNAASFAEDAAPLFAYLDRLHPNLWRSGKAYPQNYPDMKQKLADGELDIIFAFNPSEASAGIAAGELPDTVRSFTYTEGTLGNTHFVAIPYNASAKAGALVLANFLISPEAQLRKQDPSVWGDPTVLSMDKLSAEDRAAFEALDLGIATLRPDELGPALDEPHPDWMERIEGEWLKRYGAAN